MMSGITVMEKEIAKLIVQTLNLEVSPDEIDPSAPLFGEGLGLDSIDALELSVAIAQNYGVKLSSEDNDISKIFGSLRSLTEHVEKNRAR